MNTSYAYTTCNSNNLVNLNVDTHIIKTNSSMSGTTKADCMYDMEGVATFLRWTHPN